MGVAPESAKSAGNSVVPARLDFRSNPRAKMVHGTDGFVKVHAARGSGVVLGGVVVSVRASDLIQPLAVAEPPDGPPAGQDPDRLPVDGRLGRRVRPHAHGPDRGVSATAPGG